MLENFFTAVGYDYVLGVRLDHCPRTDTANAGHIQDRIGHFTVECKGDGTQRCIALACKIEVIRLTNACRGQQVECLVLLKCSTFGGVILVKPLIMRPLFRAKRKIRARLCKSLWSPHVAWRSSCRNDIHFDLIFVIRPIKEGRRSTTRPDIGVVLPLRSIL